jgi:hypothetical protein
LNLPYAVIIIVVVIIIRRVRDQGIRVLEVKVLDHQFVLAYTRGPRETISRGRTF